MADDSRPRRFQTEKRAETTVVTFIDPILDEQNSWIIKKQVADLAAEPGQRHLLLDFRNVKFLSSAVLAALLKLHRRAGELGVGISLCRLTPDLEEVFQATGLMDVFPIEK
jgi:anti-sigma B factor antagonist